MCFIAVIDIVRYRADTLTETFKLFAGRCRSWKVDLTCASGFKPPPERVLYWRGRRRGVVAAADDKRVCAQPASGGSRGFKAWAGLAYSRAVFCGCVELTGFFLFVTAAEMSRICGENSRKRNLLIFHHIFFCKIKKLLISQTDFIPSAAAELWCSTFSFLAPGMWQFALTTGPMFGSRGCWVFGWDSYGARRFPLPWHAWQRFLFATSACVSAPAWLVGLGWFIALNDPIFCQHTRYSALVISLLRPGPVCARTSFT